MANKQPLGIELVKRGIVSQQDIESALEFQKSHPNEKIGDILYEQNATDDVDGLLKCIGEVLGEKTIMLTTYDIEINTNEYISTDMMKQYLAVPFEVSGSTIKVCFASSNDKSAIESIRMLMLNKGLIMEEYITFRPIIEKIIRQLTAGSVNIGEDENATTVVDNIIRKAMEMRASDIHIEPMEDCVRVRYRIDGKMMEIIRLDKEKQTQIINRLKSLSNMHQEKQEAQDGRIGAYPDYNIRSSSQPNIYGEKFVLRLLKKNSTIKSIFDLGYPNDENLFKKSFNRKNSITIIAAPTGEGKTTTLYSAISYLNKPDVNITTIEDPVEIRIPGLNQIEIDNTRTTFAGALRTVLRQDPNIILLGEIRDRETAEIAIQASQTGHYVLSTIHTIDAIETITRLRKIGISDYDLSSCIASTISQRLVRKLCPHCKKERPFNEKEKDFIKKAGEKYNFNFNIDNAVTYDPVGCEKCNNTGYYDRIGIFETLIFTDEIKELIANAASTYDIRKKGLEQGYRPLIVEGIKRVVEGITTMDELDDKLVIY